ncbi:outer membrane beta-barrel protein [Lacibacter sediminis]|uniref:Outer membrane beta-barrel protein n=1 Tax=Lacibacter sediminis TaxID=2760713 RepID=A0A7G5XIL7_9BACT|nr:outer membrane beta-barrel protein [Lacibacter sediminis]QNA45320.1 outer membrane beta-barrel protein [Lacibacter sediminis]
MKKLLLILLVIIASVSVKAQTAGITGKVTDSTGSKGLDKATVKLVEKSFPYDTSRTSTNAKGEFSFAKIPTSAYSIVISYTGYKPMIKEFFKPSAGVSNIDLGELVLVNSYLDLKEIVIEAPAVTMKEDTVEYRAGAFQTKPNATTEELLKKLPGVQVDREGNVTAQGKAVTRVKVNGKDFFTGDPKTATKEIPADMIDKVQVIDDYGDQSTVSGIRDGEPEKVINLQLKKDKNKGIFGRAQAGYGTNDRYNGAVTVNRFNNSKQLSIIANSNNVNTSTFQQDGSSGGGNTGGGGGGRGGMTFGGGGGGGNTGGNQNGVTKLNSIGLNYRNDFGTRNSFYGSYTYSHRATSIEQYTAQENIGKTGAGSIFTNTDQGSLNKNGTHRAFGNLELWIDSFNYIKFSPSFTLTESNNRSQSVFDIFNESSLLQDGTNMNTSLSDRPNFRSNLLYNHRFKKRGRNFSFNSDLNFSSNESDQFTNNESVFYLTNGTKDSTLKQNILQDNRTRNINLRATYTEPLAVDRFLDLSYNYNKNFGSNDRQNYIQLPGNTNYTLIDSFSNAYENNFDYNRIGASLRTVKKKYNYSVGVIFQPVIMRGYDTNKDSAYKTIQNFNWFPVARFTYNFTRTKAINFNYNGIARQPSFEQLQPVPDRSNLQYQTIGNPLLRPSNSHNFNANFNNFNFSSGRIFLVNLGFNFIEDQIVNNVIFFRNSSGDKTGGQLTRPENVNGYYNANLFGTYSRPFKNRKYVISANSMVNYNNNISLVDSERNIGKNWLYTQGLNFEFNIPWLELVTGARYSLIYNDFSNASNPTTKTTTWVLSSDARFDLGAGFIFRWDFDYTINQGLAAGVQKNIALLNASLEKEVFKKKNGIIRLAGFDVFKQNTNVSRSVNNNFIVDTRTNRLTQYFMLSFTYRLNRFKGTQQPQQQNNMRRMGGERTMMMNNDNQ